MNSTNRQVPGRLSEKGVKIQTLIARLAKNNRRAVGMSMVVLAFGVIGFMLITFSHADTAIVAVEAESGTVTAPAVKVSQNGASGGQSVQFKPAETGGGGGGTAGPIVGAGPLSGLRWHSGAHVDNDIAPHNAFGSWRGRPLDIYILFTARDTWGTVTSLANVGERIGSLNPNAEVAMAVPVMPATQESNWNAGISACASGSYNNNFKQVGTSITNIGWNRPQMIVRLQHEFNLGDNRNDPAAFKACWNNAASSIKSTANKVLIDWNINGHGTPSGNCGGNAFNCYPGDQYVDIVGIDSYDFYPPSGNTAASWDSYCHAGGQGLCDVAAFARQHGKMLSVPEWGTSTHADPGQFGGDNPSYITNMAKFFDTNKDILAYESYYNAPHSIEPNNVSSGIWPGGGSVDTPQASAKYKELFGTGSIYAK